MLLGTCIAACSGPNDEPSFESAHQDLKQTVPKLPPKPEPARPAPILHNFGGAPLSQSRARTMTEREGMKLIRSAPILARRPVMVVRCST